jgi:hypothetical protein
VQPQKGLCQERAASGWAPCPQIGTLRGSHPMTDRIRRRCISTRSPLSRGQHEAAAEEIQTRMAEHLNFHALPGHGPCVLNTRLLKARNGAVIRQDVEAYRAAMWASRSTTVWVRFVICSSRSATS